jgi:hypothetical protein
MQVSWSNFLRSLSFYLLLRILPQDSSARILDPIRPGDPEQPGESLSHRHNTCSLALSPHTRLFWGERGKPLQYTSAYPNSQLAESPPKVNFILYPQDDHIGIINMEEFVDRLNYLECTNHTINISLYTFVHAPVLGAIQAAKKLWRATLLCLCSLDISNLTILLKRLPKRRSVWFPANPSCSSRLSAAV